MWSVKKSLYRWVDIGTVHVHEGTVVKCMHAYSV